MEFEGEFETHVTVLADGPRGVEAVRAWAARHRLKFLHIVLERGRTASQPMVTRRGAGTLSTQLAAAAELTRRLADEGLVATRVKVEAAPENRDVPESDADAAGRHPGRYFEHHVRLALDPGADLAALAALAQGHAAHLSRNALRDRDDGRQERFVTQRCRAAGRPAARRHLDDLLAALAAAGHPALGVEEEFVVFDSNLDLDSGWLDAADG